MTEQPEALRLADALDGARLENVDPDEVDVEMIRAELRRLRAECDAYAATNSLIVSEMVKLAGRVQKAQEGPSKPAANGSAADPKDHLEAAIKEAKERVKQREIERIMDHVNAERERRYEAEEKLRTFRDVSVDEFMSTIDPHRILAKIENGTGISKTTLVSMFANDALLRRGEKKL